MAHVTMQTYSAEIVFAQDIEHACAGRNDIHCERNKKATSDALRKLASKTLIHILPT